jgi:hypothetical protein
MLRIICTSLHKILLVAQYKVNKHIETTKIRFPEVKNRTVYIIFVHTINVVQALIKYVLSDYYYLILSSKRNKKLVNYTQRDNVPILELKKENKYNLK